MNKNPFHQVSVYEIGNSLTASLLGLLYADQSEDVFILPTIDENDYLNRNKLIVKGDSFS